MSSAINYRDHIVINPAIRSGKPCIINTRIAVTDIFDYLGRGMTIEEVLEDFPDLSLEDIQACFAFAADRDRRSNVTLPLLILSRLWTKARNWATDKFKPEQRNYEWDNISDFLDFLKNYLLVYLIILILIPIFILAYIAISSNPDKASFFATIFAAIIAFCGVSFNAFMQVIYKNNIDQEKENIKEMKPYYDKICRILKRSQNIELEHLDVFLEEFDNKIIQYASRSMAHRWKNFKKVFISPRQNPLKINHRDLPKIKNFICAIRQELGTRSSLSPFTKNEIYKDLQARYQQFTDPSYQNKDNVNNTLKFAGSWNDLTDEEFTEFSDEITLRRQQAFTNRRNDATIPD